VQRRAAFPEAGIVVVLGDLVEAELLVVIGPDPFGRVDRALLQRRIDVAAGDLLRHHAELLHDLAGEAADAHLQALRSATVLISLRYQPPIWRRCCRRARP
jgi:hypothetical protein